MWLVTGATGHIGNVLVRELLRRGEKVISFRVEEFHPIFAGNRARDHWKVFLQVIHAHVLQPGKNVAALYTLLPGGVEEQLEY